MYTPITLRPSVVATCVKKMYSYPSIVWQQSRYNSGFFFGDTGKCEIDCLCSTSRQNHNYMNVKLRPDLIRFDFSFNSLGIMWLPGIFRVLMETVVRMSF